MKSKQFLRNMVAMVSENYSTIQCSFNVTQNSSPGVYPVPKTGNNDGKLYTFKVTKEFVKTLSVGDWVVTETTQPSVAFNVARVVRINSVVEFESPETMKYVWAFSRVPVELLEKILVTEDDIVEELDRTQRRRASIAMIEQLGINEEERKMLIGHNPENFVPDFDVIDEDPTKKS